jgi:hypothetical protein
VTTSTTPSPFTETTGTARHAAFAELAATGPVQKVMLFTGVPAWLVTGYAEARELLAHPALVKTVGGPHMDAMPPDLNAAMNTHLLSTNPPDHTRLRPSSPPRSPFAASRRWRRASRRSPTPCSTTWPRPALAGGRSTSSTGSGSRCRSP